MKHIKAILVPTDLSENSRRALTYGCALAADNHATLTILHIGSDLLGWEYLADESDLFYRGGRWPVDRLLAEATLDMNRFIEPHIAALKSPARVHKRVVLGSVAEQIAVVAEEELADLVIMSPRRQHKIRHWISGSITDRVTRLSPCPVLSVTEPLPSRNWRGRWKTVAFGWPRPHAAPLGA